jgi:hypothetical protein
MDETTALYLAQLFIEVGRDDLAAEVLDTYTGNEPGPELWQIRKTLPSS